MLFIENFPSTRYHDYIMINSIKNLVEASERIKRAIADGQKIIVYSDSDGDGVCSAAILHGAIAALGGTISQVMFPNREEDGYGLNQKALAFLRDKAPALLIALDLGISNNLEIAEARELGFEVIVVDHHQPPDILPVANIIVDPKQSGDESGATYFCNAGLTLKLAQAMLGQNMSPKLYEEFLQFAALATISDMMPQIEENIDIVQKGLALLANSTNMGIKAFSQILGPREMAAAGSQKIISAINAAESENFTNNAFVLFTTNEINQCLDIAQMLMGRVRLKQQRIEQIVQEVEHRMAKNPDATIIFEGDPAWRLVLAGPVASIIAQKYQKPTFIYKHMGTESAGSVRCLAEGQNSVDAMKTCEDILITYGGHPKASGFRIKNEHLEEFRRRLGEYFAHARQSA